MISRNRSNRAGHYWSLTQIGHRKVRRAGTVYEMNTDGRGAAGKEPAAGSSPDSEPNNRVVMSIDALGIPVPDERVDVFASLPDFQEAKDLFERLASLLDRIAQSPGGQLYRQDLIRTVVNGQPAWACPALRLALGELFAAEPYCCQCPYCQAAHLAGPIPAARPVWAAGGRAAPNSSVVRRVHETRY